MVRSNTELLATVVSRTNVMTRSQGQKFGLSFDLEATISVLASPEAKFLVSDLTLISTVCRQN